MNVSQINLDELNIVIPMKDPAEAKQRLREALTDSERSELALSLFEATLHFFRSQFAPAHLLVVTSSSYIRDIADRYDCSVLLESEARGLNEALEQATHWSLRHRFSHQLIVPADIAQLDTEEVEQLLSSCPAGQGIALAEADDGGTNALLTTPPDAIAFRFGLQSANAHQHQAQLRGLPSQRLQLTRLSQDIDRPADLHYHPALQTSQGGPQPCPIN